MEIYLPIADLSVNWAMIVLVGCAVGFLSGMFGVGGGFLMAPLLVFYGIPSDIAVATQASHITASSVSGALTQWQRRCVDVKMGVLLIASGLLGSAGGVYLFRILQQLGQIELVVAASYVVLLGLIGGLMLTESVSAIRSARLKQPPPKSASSSHSWIQRLPFKLRFRRSKLYVSAIPPLVLGFLIGVMTAIMGVGGGFLMVPAMIYLLRMPTNVVVGTSQFQIVFVTAATTVLHALGDQKVDIVLALLLVAGGVVGVQFGSRFASRLRGEQLRALLALLVLAVAARLLYGLIATPGELYSIVAETP